MCCFVMPCHCRSHSTIPTLTVKVELTGFWVSGHILCVKAEISGGNTYYICPELLKISTLKVEFKSFGVSRFRDIRSCCMYAVKKKIIIFTRSQKKNYPHCIMHFVPHYYYGRWRYGVTIPDSSVGWRGMVCTIPYHYLPYPIPGMVPFWYGAIPTFQPYPPYHTIPPYIHLPVFVVSTSSLFIIRTLSGQQMRNEKTLCFLAASVGGSAHHPEYSHQPRLGRLVSQHSIGRGAVESLLRKRSLYGF